MPPHKKPPSSPLSVEAESAACYRQFTSDMISTMVTPTLTPDSVALSATMAANSGECAAIISLSVTGSTAALISKYRPRCPVLVVSRDGMTCRQAHLHRGCFPYQFSGERIVYNKCMVVSD